jgi:hypothetical protein
MNERYRARSHDQAAVVRTREGCDAISPAFCAPTGLTPWQGGHYICADYDQ